MKSHLDLQAYDVCINCVRNVSASKSFSITCPHRSSFMKFESNRGQLRVRKRIRRKNEGKKKPSLELLRYQKIEKLSSHNDGGMMREREDEEHIQMVHLYINCTLK